MFKIAASHLKHETGPSSLPYLLPFYNQQHTAMLTISCFYERFAFRNASCLTFEGLMRFLLSVTICPVFEKTLSVGTDVATMQSPCRDFCKLWVYRGLVLSPAQRICRIFGGGAPPNRIRPPLWHLLRDSFVLHSQLFSRQTVSKQQTTRDYITFCGTFCPLMNIGCPSTLSHVLWLHLLLSGGWL